MELSLTTPAILFPTISLLLIAYTNRFLAIANLIRGLRGRYMEDKRESVILQIRNLKRRLSLIRTMQVFGVASLLVAIFDIFALYFQWEPLGHQLFLFSLVLMFISLLICFGEVLQSGRALDIELNDMMEERSGH